jgi:hypothetical protein
VSSEFVLISPSRLIPWSQDSFVRGSTDHKRVSPDHPLHLPRLPTWLTSKRRETCAFLKDTSKERDPAWPSLMLKGGEVKIALVHLSSSTGKRSGGPALFFH